MSDDILFEVRERIGFVTFNRPQARNAMTFAMYERLGEICTSLDPSVQVLILRGAGGKAFVSGTDISQFESGFATAQDQNLHRGVEAGADLAQPLVHRKGHGVARLRPVEGDEADPLAHFEEDVVAHAGTPMTFASVRRRISSAEWPSSRSTSTECSPSSGPAFSMRAGVRDMRMGEPTCRTGPSFL